MSFHYNVPNIKYSPNVLKDGFECYIILYEVLVTESKGLSKCKEYHFNAQNEILDWLRSVVGYRENV